MSADDDGGPAFLMSLRDYFAIHSIQPGAGEICAAADVTVENGLVFNRGASVPLGTFDHWFSGLPFAERLRLFSVVKYAMADAMLEASKQP
jgi:hypothetical protein